MLLNKHKTHILSLWLLIKEVKRKSLIAIALLLFQGVTEGIGLLLIIPLLTIAGIQSSNVSNERIVKIVEKLFETTGVEVNVISVLFIYLFIIFVFTGIKYFQSINTAKINRIVVLNWRKRFFESIIYASWLRFKSFRQSDLQNIITVEIQKFGAITNQLNSSISNFVLILVYLGVSTLISAELTLLAIIPIVLIGFLNRPINRRTYETGKSTVGHNQKLQLIVLEQLNALKLVKAYQKESFHIEEFEKNNRELEDKVIHFQEATQKTKVLFNVIASISVALFIYLALEIFKSSISEVLLLILIFSRLSPKVTSLVNGYQRMLNFLPALEKTREYFDQLANSNELFEGECKEKVDFRDGINLKNVRFSYGENVIFNELSFSIPKDKITLIKGSSGRGKSTLIDLVLGLNQPESGEILIGDEPLTKSNLSHWRSLIAYVPQEPFLFHESIRYNLEWTKPGVKEQEIWKTLEQVSAADFVKNLPDGIDTLVGDRGGALSGGERQRIVLARALLYDPKLLILDEATNELDYVNEQLIVNTLAELKGQVTILVATHKNSFDSIADQRLEL